MSMPIETFIAIIISNYRDLVAMRHGIIRFVIVAFSLADDSPIIAYAAAVNGKACSYFSISIRPGALKL